MLLSRKAPELVDISTGLGGSVDAMQSKAAPTNKDSSCPLTARIAPDLPVDPRVWIFSKMIRTLWLTIAGLAVLGALFAFVPVVLSPIRHIREMPEADDDTPSAGATEAEAAGA